MCFCCFDSSFGQRLLDHFYVFFERDGVVNLEKFQEDESGSIQRFKMLKAEGISVGVFINGRQHWDSNGNPLYWFRDSGAQNRIFSCVTSFNSHRVYSGNNATSAYDENNR